MTEPTGVQPPQDQPSAAGFAAPDPGYVPWYVSQTPHSASVPSADAAGKTPIPPSRPDIRPPTYAESTSLPSAPPLSSADLGGQSTPPQPNPHVAGVTYEAGAPTAGGYGYGAYGGYGTVGAGYGQVSAQPRTNGLAIASMTVSIVGATLLFCYGVGGLISLVGAILGHVSRRQSRERGESGDGMAKAGIIVGWISFALGLAFIGLLVAFFISAVNDFQ